MWRAASWRAWSRVSRDERQWTGRGRGRRRRCRAGTARGAARTSAASAAGGQGGGGDGEVAGGLVEAHGQAAAGRADEVDLHDDGGGPGQALVDAEQDVGGDDPAPGRCPDQHERDGQADQPAGDQDGFAAVAVGQGAGEEVGDGLGDAERDDVGQRGGVGGEVRRPASASSGSTVRSWPSMPPTRALTATSRLNWARLARSPSRMRRGVGGGGRSRGRPPGVRPVAVAQSSGPPTRTATSRWPARCEQAGGGHGAFAVPAHHHRAVRSASPACAARSPSSMWTRAGQVPGGVLGCPGGRRAPAPSTSVGRDQRGGRLAVRRRRSRRPCRRRVRRRAARSRCSARARRFGRVLVGVADDDDRDVGVERASPARWRTGRRSGMDDRAGDVAGGEVGDRAHVDERPRRRRAAAAPRPTVERGAARVRRR